MPSVFRYVRGDVRALWLPALNADTVEIGDLLWWDAANGAVRPASTVSGADYATKKANLAATFIGVALTAKPANTAGGCLVATAGDFLFDAPTGTAYTVGDGVAGGDGSNMVNQTVVRDTTAANQIAKVVQPKAASQNTVMVRVLSKLGRI